MVKSYLEFIQSKKKCPEDFTWSPIEKKCVPIVAPDHYFFTNRKRPLLIEPPDGKPKEEEPEETPEKPQDSATKRNKK